jgi:hypothetical protein
MGGIKGRKSEVRKNKRISRWDAIKDKGNIGALAFHKPGSNKK